MLPRWRSIERTSAVELSSVGSRTPELDPEIAHRVLKSLYEQWRESPTLANASEVIDSAVFLEKPFLAIGPAKAIIEDENAMPAIKRVAQFVLKGITPPDPEVTKTDGSRSEIEEKIRALKARATDEPRNALIWLEQARLHTLIGDLSGGDKAIRRAFGAAPTNRLVLRALCRFLVHAGRSEEAHEVLARSARLRHDPWLQSAELATAEAANKGPISAKHGRAALTERAYSPIHLSELSAALGTLEARSGAQRAANRHFRQSLEAPTENALSQAYWAQEQLGVSVNIQHSMLTIQGAFEARVRDALRRKNWQLAASSCEKWLQDEPFSIRAAIDGSFIASSLLWSPALTVDLCDGGLFANPNELTLLNNKAVALLRLGRKAEAHKCLEKLKGIARDWEGDPTFLATSGLYHFVNGDISHGREFYGRAVDTARQKRQVVTLFRALVHWLYEEIQSGQVSNAGCTGLIKQLDEKAEKLRLTFETRESWTVMKSRMTSTREYRKDTPEAAPLPTLFNAQLTAPEE